MVVSNDIKASLCECVDCKKIFLPDSDKSSKYWLAYFDMVQQGIQVHVEAPKCKQCSSR